MSSAVRLTEIETKLLRAAAFYAANSADGEFHGWQLAKNPATDGRRA